jgi:hypothetical protein
MMQQMVTQIRIPVSIHLSPFSLSESTPPGPLAVVFAHVGPRRILVPGVGDSPTSGGRPRHGPKWANQDSPDGMTSSQMTISMIRSLGH